MDKSVQRIIGIDPGFDRIGWAVFHRQGATMHLIDCGCIQTTKQLSRLERYLELEQQLTQILDKHQPTTAGIEQLYAARNTTTVIAVAEARGIILSCLLKHTKQIHELNPSTVKSAVAGSGRADKVAMKKMVLLQLGKIDPTLRTKVEKTLDDTIDAIGIALTAATLRSTV